MSVVTTITASNRDEWLAWTSTQYPALTTWFQSPSNCSTRWIRSSSQIFSGDDEFGLEPSRDGLASDYYAGCRPFNQPQPMYNPGMCTAGQKMVAISERRFQNSIFWEGRCCDSDMTIPSGSANCEKTFRTPMAILTLFTTTLNEQLVPCLNYAEPAGNFTVFAIDLSTTICSRLEGGNVRVDETVFRRQPIQVTTGTATASPVIVYWHSSELYQFPSDYAYSLASVIKVPFGEKTSTPISKGPNDKRPSLSPGAIAGIAIGIGTVVISSIVILLYLWRRRKQRQLLQHPDVPEMEGSSRGLKRFMGGKWRAETDGTSEPVEAGSTSVRIIPGPPVELDGTQRERDPQSHT